MTETPNPKKKIAAVLISVLALVLLIGLSMGAGLFTKKEGAPEQSPLSTSETPGEQSHDSMAHNTPADTGITDVVNEATVGAEPNAAPAVTSAVSGAIDMNAVKTPRIMGSPDAPVKIIEFASLTCSHCAHFHKDILPQLKEKYIDKGLVSIEFKEFPLNAAALDASILARCLPLDKYEAYISLLFKTQDDWTAQPDYITTLKQNAKLAGLSDEQASACLADPAVKQFVAQGVKEGTEKWKVESTPTFIINDGKERISGAMPLYEFERVFRVVTDGKVAAIETPQSE